MRKLLSFFSLLILSSIHLAAQVNVQQGSAQFELPIFNFSDIKSGLTHKVALSYSSGNGLKVNTAGSDIGLGWELIAGGSITRVQNGEPDDQSSVTQFPPVAYGSTYGYNQAIGLAGDVPGYPVVCTPEDYVTKYYPNGFLYSEFPLDMTDVSPLKYAAPKELGFLPRFKPNMDKRWKQSRRTLTDRQQDIFILNINERAVEFVIGKNGQVACLQSSLLKITPIHNTTADWKNKNRTTISGFTVTDENGIIYEFLQPDYAEVLKPVSIDAGSGKFSFSRTGEEGEGKYTIDQWSLTSIINPFTNEKINFTYQLVPDGSGTDYIAQKIPGYEILQKSNAENINLHESRAKGKKYRLMQIDFPNKYALYLNYLITPTNEFILRKDLPEEPILASITIKNNSNLQYNTQFVAKYSFKQGYFYKKEIKEINDPVAEPDKRYLRLCLQAVQKTGVVVANTAEEPPYQFTYYTGSSSVDPKDIVPPTDCFAQDHWGYYNKSSIVDITQPVPAKEVLKDLMVNANLYRNPATGTAGLGLLQSIINPAKGQITYEYEQNMQDAVINGQTTAIATGGVHVSKVKQFDGIDHAKDIITKYDYVLDNGRSSLWGYEAPVYNLYREMTIAKSWVGYTQGGVLVSNTTGSLIKGLATNIVSKKLSKLVFASMIKSGSSIFLASAFAAAYAFVIAKLIEGIFVLADPFDYEQNNNYQFYPMNYNNPIGTHISRVQITNASLAGGTGSVIQDFSRPNNITTEIASNNFLYSSKQRYATWQFDQLKRELVYDNANKLISETNYTYNTVKSTLSTIDFLSCKVEANRLYSSHCEDNLNTQPISNLSYDFYNPVTGRSELIAIDTKQYSNSGVTASTNSTIAYNADYQPKASTVEKSNGDKIVTKTYYVKDYNDAVSPAIALLKQRGAVNVAVSTETWLIKSGSLAEYLVDATVNEFSILPNNDVKVIKTYGIDSKQPIPYNSVQYQNPSQLIRNNQYFKPQQEFIYDADGNMAESRSKGGEISCSIFDYEKRMATATATNAHYNDIAYTSFEAQNKGNWVFDNAGIILWDVVTGKQCFDLSGRSISTTIAINKDYILSFWAKGDAVNVSGGAVLSKTGPSLAGWTYYEYKLKQGTGSPVINGSGSPRIDELRLYPAESKMATTTYDPVAGKPTSQCDINNHILYYEYDPLSRLVKVRDENKNLIKTYEYHFKN